MWYNNYMESIPNAEKKVRHMTEFYLKPNMEDFPIRTIGTLKHIERPETLYGMLSALLFRSGEMGGDIQEELLANGIVLPEEGSYRVFMVELDDPKLQTMTGRQRHRKRLALYAAMRGRLAEALPEETNGFLVLMLGCLVGILFPAENGEALTEACQKVVDYTKEVLGYEAHVTISNLHDNIRGIASAYRMAQDFENSRSFYTGMAERVFCLPEMIAQRLTDHKQRTDFEQTFDDASERICGSIQAEDVDVAARYMQDQLRRIAENCMGMPYPTTLNLTVNRFLYQLQYRLTDQNLADWRYITQMDFSRELISQATLEDYLAEGRVIVEKLVEHYRVRTKDQYASLMHDIRTYVVENATDVNMGLTSVSREFKLKPREAAESFRKFFGESVNDVIHKTRVAKAKRLLLETDEPVQEIAAAVGYCSLATMYRAFTNVEGVAPGRLRKTKKDT